MARSQSWMPFLIQQNLSRWSPPHALHSTATWHLKPRGWVVDSQRTHGWRFQLPPGARVGAVLVGRRAPPPIAPPIALPRPAASASASASSSTSQSAHWRWSGQQPTPTVESARARCCTCRCLRRSISSAISLSMQATNSLRWVAVSRRLAHRRRAASAGAKYGLPGGGVKTTSCHMSSLSRPGCVVPSTFMWSSDATRTLSATIDWYSSADSTFGHFGSSRSCSRDFARVAGFSTLYRARSVAHFCRSPATVPPACGMSSISFRGEPSSMDRGSELRIMPLSAHCICCGRVSTLTPSSAGPLCSTATGMSASYSRASMSSCPPSACTLLTISASKRSQSPSGFFRSSSGTRASASRISLPSRLRTAAPSADSCTLSKRGGIFLL